ncbi:2-keto-3-deoxygalactonate kinase [Luteibacter rhizovicinus]|uniref:2-keto-3-deoxygalactonate kinase n=1 Tax=Luteibacter rhizovicinus TaxID=242606 RepID=A0A4R3YUE3_9GAMM|nr:2-dehydro-3-deoxygalactonokinase [Luteibacter rhizovicinus]TCV96150.1 2-keto-3-deoxygalactonate kinase [Luteibacter rhizovicinus]
MNILTIDTGTTNTRVCLWRDGQVVAHAARQVGVRDTAISGSRDKLEAAVRETIEEALTQASLDEDAVELVLASGMITSNMGLCEIPHVVAPAGLDTLAAAMRESTVPTVWKRPIWFVPGVRNAVEHIGLHNCEAMDMMRGEEVESFALVERLGLKEPAVIVLPGSHSKFVSIDAKQRIAGCVTTLAGELLHVISHDTILASSLKEGFAKRIDKEMLLAGARSAKQIGLGRACFSVRILDQFAVYDANARANFLLGAVLGSDLLTLKNSSAIRMNPGTRFVVSGKPILREAIALLVEGDDFFSGAVTVLSDDEQRDLAGYGVIAVARVRGLVDTNEPALG